jgi:hypothetical protein
MRNIREVLRIGIGMNRAVSAVVIRTVTVVNMKLMTLYLFLV